MAVTDPVPAAPDLLGRRTGHTFGGPPEDGTCTRLEWWITELHRRLSLWEDAYTYLGRHDPDTRAAAIRVEEARRILHEIKAAGVEASRQRGTGRGSLPDSPRSFLT